MKKWFVIAATIVLVVVGSVAVWQLSGDDTRRAGALEVSEEPMALSWRGVPYVLRDRAAQGLRRYPRLAERVRRAVGPFATAKIH